MSIFEQIRDHFKPHFDNHGKQLRQIIKNQEKIMANQADLDAAVAALSTTVTANDATITQIDTNVKAILAGGNAASVNIDGVTALGSQLQAQGQALQNIADETKPAPVP